jgi:hypothetical protein
MVKSNMAKPRKRGKPKRKQGDHPKEAIVLIPLTYNDGTEIPRETIESISDEVYVAFNGWMIKGTVKGAYRMQSGVKRVENLLEVSIVLGESLLPELEEMVGRWAARLGQETILLKITDYVVKFVPPRPEAGSP